MRNTVFMVNQVGDGDRPDDDGEPGNWVPSYLLYPESTVIIIYFIFKMTYLVQSLITKNAGSSLLNVKMMATNEL